MAPPASSWLIGSGTYTASWDGVGTLTVTVTATGQFVASFSGQDFGDLSTQLDGWAQGNPS